MRVGDGSAYKLLVRGTGLHRMIDGVDTPVGVYATVFVTEVDENGARLAAIDELQARLGAKDATTEHTRLEVESIERIRANEIPKVQPGFTFYRE